MFPQPQRFSHYPCPNIWKNIFDNECLTSRWHLCWWAISYRTYLQLHTGYLCLDVIMLVKLEEKFELIIVYFLFSELWNWHFLVSRSRCSYLWLCCPSLYVHQSCHFPGDGLGFTLLLVYCQHLTPQLEFTLSYLETITTYYCDSYLSLWPLSLTRYIQVSILFTWHDAPYTALYMDFFLLSFFFPSCLPVFLCILCQGPCWVLVYIWWVELKTLTEAKRHSHCIVELTA